MKYTFKFKLFGSKVQMFHEDTMGIVIEKEPDVVCVYGTDAGHQNILCAVPLCHPRFLRGAEYTICFGTDHCAEVSVGDLKIRIDYENRKCSNNKNIQCYGSDQWGENVSAVWSEQ